MQQISAAIAMILAATLAGCGTFRHNTVADAQDLDKIGRPDIKTTVDGSIPVKSLSGKRVFVSFRNSGKLTKVLAGIVERSGGGIAEVAEQADLILEGHGEFAATRQYGNRRARADVGEAFEKNGEVLSLGRELRIPISPGGALMNAGQATVIMGTLDAISDVTGVRGWFNNLVAGDPDGICFRGCEYKQAVVIEIVMKDSDGKPVGESRVTSRTDHKTLLPLPLIDTALNALTVSLVTPDG